MHELKSGDHVSVRAHKSEPGKGLSYGSFQGILLDFVGTSESWDVVDVNHNGETVSVYTFSIVR